MTPSGPVAAAVADRLAVALAAARVAGADTLGWFQGAGLVVDTKADASPVTQADRAAEAILRRELLGAFPDDAFLGEETGATPGVSGWECRPDRRHQVVCHWQAPLWDAGRAAAQR